MRVKLASEFAVGDWTLLGSSRQVYRVQITAIRIEGTMVIWTLDTNDEMTFDHMSLVVEA